MKTFQFVDTNVLIYSISRNPSDNRKRVRAAEILRNRNLVMSVQVLQEFYVQSTRPSRTEAISHDAAVTLIKDWRRFKIVDSTAALLDVALKIKERYGFHYWDCAIIAAAKELKCDVLYTEDLQHNQVIEGVRVINPFLD